MTPLTPADLAAFPRKFRFPGGRLRGVRLRSRPDGTAVVDLILVVRPVLKDLGDEPQPTRLRLRLTGVDEFRFQKRAATTAGRIVDARFGYFDGKFFVDLDAYALDPGDRPGVHDYRASDAYAAGRTLAWEELPPRAVG